jgi:hypothetical protein
MAEAEVEDGAAEDGDEVGDEQGKVRGADQQSHEGEIAEHGDQTVGEMKAQELGEQGGAAAAVAPGVVEVSDKVVQQGEFEGRGGGKQIMAHEAAVEESKRGELDGHADGSDEIELDPANESAHGNGS